MAWGGGGGGFFGGGGMGRPGGWNMSAPGLPFAGIPPDMVKAVEKLVEKEPEFKLEDVPFSNQVDEKQPPFTLRRFLSPKKVGILGVMVLVAFEVVCQQIGPRLAQMGIDKGVVPKKFEVVLVLSMVYLG